MARAALGGRQEWLRADSMSAGNEKTRKYGDRGGGDRWLHHLYAYMGRRGTSIDSSPWPAGFARIPPEDWTSRPVERLAEHYDTVERHGWYDNLDPTVAQMAELISEGDIWVDYSGGTGILIDRLLGRLPERVMGIVNVDSSPKFLRLALEKLRPDSRVAFRWIRYLKDEKRLQLLDEVLAGPLLERRIDGLVSTNAIHLYYDLPDTLASWRRVVRPGGSVLIQSGNIGAPDGVNDGWIIDETVHAIAAAAVDVVRDEPRFGHLASLLDDKQRMTRYDELRSKYFLPVRPVDYYVDALASAGLPVESVQRKPIAARVDEWFEFLAVYHEGVLGWIGGAEKLEGVPATPNRIDDRLAVMRRAMEHVFDGRDTFEATWTYITAKRPSE